MELATGSLVIIGANTPQVQVFWNGAAVSISSLKIVDGKVYLSIPEDTAVEEMKSAGIIVRRNV